MWNQWSVGPPPLPSNSVVNPTTLIGPVQPTAPVPAQTFPSVQTIQSTMYPAPSGAPSYTPAQFAAMTPEQQYAVQQHWQQWQAYEQQYAQWHAQYGEQYKREMAAMHGTTSSVVPAYSTAVPPPVGNSFSFPPPTIVNTFPKHPTLVTAPPPPPPEETSKLTGVNAPPHIYEQPPPPPPPPQTENKQDERPQSLTQCQSLPPSFGSAAFVQNQNIRWSQPPPNMLMQEKHSEQPNLVNQQKIQQSNEFNHQFNNSQYMGHDNNDQRNRLQCKTGQNFENSRQLENAAVIKNQEERSYNNRGVENSRQLENAAVIKNQEERSYNNRGVFNSNRSDNCNNDNKSAGSAMSSQSPAKTSNVSVDEKTFDEQFRLWEEQFENWKRENANHPDRMMYVHYEREFEKTRTLLLERREQIRRRKLLERQQQLQQISPKEKLDNLDKTDIQSVHLNDCVTGGTQSKVEFETSNDADDEQNKSKKANVVEQQEIEGAIIMENCGLENNVFQNKEITDIFKSASGIPGLDLVAAKDEEKASDRKVVGPEIIDLDRDAITLGASQSSSSTKSPLLDSYNREETVTSKTDTTQRKIPSLFDIVIEKPPLSPGLEKEHKTCLKERSPPEITISKSADSPSRSISRDRNILSPGQKSTSSANQGHAFLNSSGRSSEEPGHQFFENRRLVEQTNVPQNVSEIAKILQDPNVMQILSVALAQAQKTGGMGHCNNSQQSQLLQQLQQLQPLLQIQQEGNRMPQYWNSQQSQRPHSSQNQNQTLNMNPINNSGQNRSPWNNNHFNRNIEQGSICRGPDSGNKSGASNDIQQRNPHNPFRRNVGGGPGSDNNIGCGNLSFGSIVNQGSFESKFDQQQRSNFNGGGRFDNNRPISNIGMSLGFRNNQNRFGDRGGGDDECYRPAQVFEYQNRSRTDAVVPPTKVVDYGHRTTPVVSTNSFNRDNSEFVPVKTIDYGHASSSVQVENQFSKNIPNNDKKRNLEQHRTQMPMQRNKNSVPEKEKTNELPSKIIQTTNDLENNDQILQGGKKMKVIGNDQQNQMDINEMKKNDDVEEQYPRNKWILQNPEARARPGPPTKRGRRHNIVNIKNDLLLENDREYDEIEENFEEISDNEEINETAKIEKSEQDKVKIRPLFPSVSESITNATMVFPSMENNNTIPIDEILFKPGRLTRPKNIVIIIRGPPGSGKSHVAKLIKEKEIEMGGTTPRLLSIDDYFMIENDYVEKCPKSGRKVPKKEILYEYEKEMEDTYMQYLIKSFKKTVSDHLFDFIIVDCCNQSLRTFNEFYNAARDGNFSPFIVDMKCDVDKCLSQNIHERNEDDIRNIVKNYQDCPGHYIKLDVTNLLENVVEMEDVSDLEDNLAADSEINDPDEDEEGDDINAGGFLKSKWDTDPTTENLARLDGTSKPISKRGTATLEEYLQIDGWEPPPSSTNGKKRVRWADIEEKRAQEKMRAIGFVVGQTDWSRMMDPTSGSGALTKTKYIERLNRRR